MSGNARRSLGSRRGAVPGGCCNCCVRGSPELSRETGLSLPVDGVVPDGQRGAAHFDCACDKYAVRDPEPEGRGSPELLERLLGEMAEVRAGQRRIEGSLSRLAGQSLKTLSEGWLDEGRRGDASQRVFRECDAPRCSLSPVHPARAFELPEGSVPTTRSTHWASQSQAQGGFASSDSLTENCAPLERNRTRASSSASGNATLLTTGLQAVGASSRRGGGRDERAQEVGVSPGARSTLSETRRDSMSPGKYLRGKFAHAGGSSLVIAEVIPHLFNRFRVARMNEPKREGRIATCIEGKQGMFVALLVMVLECAFVTRRTDDLVPPGPTLSSQPWVIVVDTAFLAFYSTELTLRAWVHRHWFFVGKNCPWNILDLILVTTSCVALMQQAGVIAEQPGPIRALYSSFRMLRVIRVFRVISVIRELRQILNAVVASMASLFFSLSFLAIILFAFSTIFVQGAAEYLAKSHVSLMGCESTDMGSDAQGNCDLISKFGSVRVAMLTLYMSCTGGDDWNNAYELCALCGDFYGVMFLFFNVVIQVAVLNIITSQFVEHAMKASEQDRERQALEQMQEQKDQINRIRELVGRMDFNRSGKISHDEFQQFIQQNPSVLMQFRELGIEPSHLESFFHMLQSTAHADSHRHEGHEVPIRAFVRGCMKMKGSATSIDMQAALCALEQLRAEVDGLSRQRTS